MASEPSATSPSGIAGDGRLTVDQLAQRVDVPVRTIREYQTLGLLHPPHRAGRVGLYDSSHRRRLQLIARLQHRGYSLAGIADLLAAWRDGAALTDVLGLEPDQLVHVDEPGARITLDQLTNLVPALVPERLVDLVATHVVEASGQDGYCIPSPSLLQLAIDGLGSGLGPDTVLDLLLAFRTAADSVAGAVLDAIAHIPGDSETATVDAFLIRGRGLLAHGIGRLTLHRIGQAAGLATAKTPTHVTERLRSQRQPERGQ